MTYKPTPTDEIAKIHARLCATFASGRTLPFEYRRAQLLALARMMQENVDALLGALYSDLGRHKFEGNMPEIGIIVQSSITAANSVEAWMKPDKPQVEEWRSSYNTTVHKVPKGTVVVISPWNYPIISSLNPFVGVIAAGCTGVLKPSEYSPAVSSLFAELFPKYLDPDAYAVINGAELEATHMLEFRWDHIFLTGSSRIGRLVAAAAAKHLTPVTLELGGKSPAFVDAGHVDLDIAARRMLWGRTQNSGQVCVAPDYVIVLRTHQDALVAAFQKAYDSFWPQPKGPLDEKSELANIIHSRAQTRLQNLISGTKGTIVIGGRSEGRRIEPTIVKDVKLDDVLMDAEIFGPILPIIPVDDINEAIRIICERPTPLVVYVFTENEVTTDLFLRRTRSGQLVVNDVLQQVAVHEMPFNGCGESGYGSYLGKYSFDAFTHLRGSINVPLSMEPFLVSRYPPYTEEAYQLSTAITRVQIPTA